MFRKIVVAFNDSQESQRALASAVKLAVTLHAELQAVTVMQDLPAYTAYASVVDASSTRVLEDDRRKFYEQLQEKARAFAQRSGIVLHAHLIGGRHVESIVAFLREIEADLLVIGLHQRDLHISRLWSTVYELAQDAPCSVLGVH
jgi:nucleotide-binding universal stress UspA family protein